MPLHIVIADDHAAIRLGLKYLILDWMPGTVVSYAEDMSEFLQMLAKGPLDMVILDTDILGGNSFQMIKTIKEKQRNAKILIFSTHDEALYAFRYLEAGTDGYLQKNKREEDIREALSTVLKGGKYISAALKENLLKQRLQPTKAQDNPLAQLSNRELEICHLLVRGKGVSEIANSLLLHTSTVATYKTKIYEKLGVQNVIDLFNKYNSHAIRVE